jgi:NAD(P)-dependent dehydrogenase (short-subunit alcohol dehydrogenase family)
VTYFKRTLTKEGFETTFAVNHLAPFLLTNLLLDLLKKSSPSRIINVSSEMHKRGVFCAVDLQWAKGYSWSKSYCSSKLYNILFSLELSKRLKDTGVTANALHPGLVKTNIGAGQGIMSFTKRVVDVFAINSFEGAKTSIHLAISDEAESITGKYFEKCKQVLPVSKYLTEENARLLWEASSNMAGL